MVDTTPPPTTLLQPTTPPPTTSTEILLSPLLTPTPTPWLMTTQRPTSTSKSPTMETAMSRDLTLLLFPMAESRLSSTPPTDMTDLSLMSPMRELPSTQRPSHTTQLPPTSQPLSTPLPQPTMPKPSLCFVKIYLFYLLTIKMK